MKESTYRKDEAKYLKLIAEAIGKEQVTITDLPHSWSEKRVSCVGRYAMEKFNPEHNAEQWQELLFWYHEKLAEGLTCSQTNTEIYRILFYATESPIALILAILDLIGVEDAKS